MFGNWTDTVKGVYHSLDWGGSVGWVSSHKVKGRWFDFQSGYMLGLQARSPSGGLWVATDQCFSHT